MLPPPALSATPSVSGALSPPGDCWQCWKSESQLLLELTAKTKRETKYFSD